MRLFAPTTLLLLGLLAGCASGPATEQFQRPAGKPVQSLHRLLADEFSPACLGADVAKLRRSATAFLAHEVAGAARMQATTRTLGAQEVRRPGHVGKTTATGLTAELSRLHHLVPKALSDEVAPDHMGKSIHDLLADVVRTLQLDHQPLAELTDPRHRTDPDDDSLPMSLGERLLRRLWH